MADLFKNSSGLSIQECFHCIDSLPPVSDETTQCTYSGGRSDRYYRAIESAWSTYSVCSTEMVDSRLTTVSPQHTARLNII